MVCGEGIVCEGERGKEMASKEGDEVNDSKRGGRLPFHAISGQKATSMEYSDLHCEKKFKMTLCSLRFS